METHKLETPEQAYENHLVLVIGIIENYLLELKTQGYDSNRELQLKESANALQSRANLCRRWVSLLAKRILGKYGRGTRTANKIYEIFHKADKGIPRIRSGSKFDKIRIQEKVFTQKYGFMTNEVYNQLRKRKRQAIAQTLKRLSLTFKSQDPIPFKRDARFSHVNGQGPIQRKVETRE